MNHKNFVMKIGKYFVFGLLGLLIIAPSCATIIGGSNYNAHVKVNNHPNASIIYKGSTKGNGRAMFKAPRKEANIFAVTVVQDNCEPQTFKYTKRKFRTGAFIGTLLGWTGVVNGIPLPWGVLVDGLAGSLWKPDVNEDGITKTDYKNYHYNIEYTGCQVETVNTMDIPRSKAARIKELNDLYKEGVLTEEEYKRGKENILSE